MYWDNITIEYNWAGGMIMNGQYKSLVVYDVHNGSGECVRTCNTMELAVQYCQSKHTEWINGEDGCRETYEIKTVVRIYWVEE